jgi:DNA repair exonuclease SbcCD ATPase subunit
MGRAPTISYEAFEAAALDLTASGQGVTFRAAQQRLGGGSYEVLRRYIERFNAERPERETGGARIPDVIRGGMQTLYAQALAQAERQVRDELAAEAADLANQRKELAKEHDQWHQRLAAAEAEARLLRERVAVLDEDRADLHQRLDAERQQHAQVQAQLARTEGTLDAERAAHAQALEAGSRERQQLVSGMVEQLERTQARFEGLQQHALRQVDEMRTKHVAVIDKALAQTRAQLAATVAQGVKVIDELPGRLVDAERAGAERRTELEQVLAKVESTVGGVEGRLGERLSEIEARQREAKEPRSGHQTVRRTTRLVAKKSTNESGQSAR